LSWVAWLGYAVPVNIPCTRTMAHTARQAAEAIYASMTCAVSPETLLDYGLVAPPEQAQRIAVEVLALSLFWIRRALMEILGSRYESRVFAELQRRVESNWPDFNLPLDPQRALEETGRRHATYEPLAREGGPPVTVFGEAAQALEREGVVTLEDRQKLLALFIDLVPVETFGEVLSELDVREA
jgi:hypothetical protein